MPHPKRRHSNHRTGIRRSHLALKVAPPQRCPRCGTVNKPHRVCENCGYYGFEKGGQKGADVLEKEEF